jgi:hypothetical protein
MIERLDGRHCCYHDWRRGKVMDVVQYLLEIGRAVIVVAVPFTGLPMMR